MLLFYIPICGPSSIKPTLLACQKTRAENTAIKSQKISYHVLEDLITMAYVPNIHDQIPI
jgi:hypothetical protein